MCFILVRFSPCLLITLIPHSPLRLYEIQSEFLQSALAVGSGGLGWHPRATIPSSAALSKLIRFLNGIVPLPWFNSREANPGIYKGTFLCLLLLFIQIIYVRPGVLRVQQDKAQPSTSRVPLSRFCEPRMLHLPVGGIPMPLQGGEA